VGSSSTNENSNLEKGIYKISQNNNSEIQYFFEYEKFDMYFNFQFHENNGFELLLRINSKVDELLLDRYFIRVSPGFFSEMPERENLIYYLSDEKAEKFKLSKKESINNIPSARWAAMTSQYYALALFNRNFSNIDISNYKITSDNKEIPVHQIRFHLPEQTVKKDSEISFEYKGYIGEKLLDKVEDHGLEGLLDLGFFAIFARLFLVSLRNLNSFTSNWGISIILLTVILRILLHPFNISQAKSMAKMQKVQPEMNAIKAKYKDNPQKMNAEIMELYKKHNMNPFGGCLPMLLQIPILFALFTMLRTSIEIKGASFLWLADLSKPDVMYILPILIAVSMYYQQKSMQVNQSAPGQSQMMVMMPVMMFVITLSLPSGVLVYWFISNILSYFQQKYVNKHVYGGKK